MARAQHVERLLDLLVGSRCLTCGQRGASTPCVTCLERIRALPRAPDASFADRAELARIVRVGKDGDWRGAARVLAPLMIERLESGAIDLVTWVPSAGTRRRRRGGHLPRRLARAIAHELHVPAASLLRRRPRTPTQRGLDRDGRVANAQHAFLLARSAVRRPPVPGQRVLLVDDVRTTGATLQACTRLLRELGLAVVPLALAGVNVDAELLPESGGGGVGPDARRNSARSGIYRLTEPGAPADGNDQQSGKARLD